MKKEMIIEWVVQIMFMVTVLMSIIFVPMIIFMGNPAMTLGIVLPMLCLVFGWMLRKAKED